MKHENKSAFKTAAPPPKPGLSMMEAIKAARAAVLEMTGIEADGITECEKDEAGGWKISVDVIESPARLGDNDLLATYAIQIGPDRELMRYSRIRRYHREGGDV